MDRNTLPDIEGFNCPHQKMHMYLAKEDSQLGGISLGGSSGSTLLWENPKRTCLLPQNLLYNSIARNKVDRKRKETFKTTVLPRELTVTLSQQIKNKNLYSNLELLRKFLIPKKTNLPSAL